MKRIVAIMIACCMLISVLTAAANAQTKGSDLAAEPNSVISAEMSAELEKMQDDDTIATWIEYDYTPYTDEEVISLTEQQCGFSEEEIESLEQKHLYYNTLWAVIKSLRLEYAADLLEKMGISEDQIIGGWNKDYGEMPNKYNLSKAQILKAAEIEEVTLIDLYKNQDITETQPPTIAPTELPTEPLDPPTDLYRERLKEYYNLSEFDGDWYTYQLMSYQELYYHRDNNGEIDWALIQCYCNIESPIEYTNVVGNRVLHPGREFYPFSATYGIYDVKNDKFVDATGKAAYQYDNFVRAFDEIVGSGMGEPLADVDNRGKGRPLGDIDNDDELSVVDVTMIQRCEASMMEYPATDEFMITYDYNTIHYYSDFNRDGERDIIDATSIQRYLAGMPYVLG